MRNRRSRFLCLVAMLLCLPNLACGLAIGPQTKTEYLILHPGRPMQVLENGKVKGRVVDGTGEAVEQDMGGWVAMPSDHWEAVKRGLEQKKP